MMVLHTSDPRKEEGSTLEGYIEGREKEWRINKRQEEGGKEEKERDGNLIYTSLRKLF